MLSSQEKAKAGLWMLKQAIVEVLGDRKMSPSQVRNALGLERPEKPFGGVVYAVMVAMMEAGELDMNEATPPLYSVNTSTKG